MQARREVALATGASRGIGRAIALARDGFALAVNYRERAAETEGLVSAIEAAGGEAMAIAADMADAGAVERLFRHTVDHFGRLDVVVANAGVAHFAAFEALAPAALDELARGTPLGRLGEAEEVADVVAFLAGPGRAG